MSQTQTTSIEDTLSNVRLVRGLDRKYLAHIAETALIRSVEPSGVIVRERQSDIGLDAIGSGPVEIVQPRAETGHQLHIRRARSATALIQSVARLLGQVAPTFGEQMTDRRVADLYRASLSQGD